MLYEKISIPICVERDPQKVSELSKTSSLKGAITHAQEIGGDEEYSQHSFVIFQPLKSNDAITLRVGAFFKADMIIAILNGTAGASFPIELQRPQTPQPHEGKKIKALRDKQANFMSERKTRVIEARAEGYRRMLANREALPNKGPVSAAFLKSN